MEKRAQKRTRPSVVLQKGTTKNRSKMAKERDKDMTFTAAPQTDKEATIECGRAKEKIKIAGNKT